MKKKQSKPKKAMKRVGTIPGKTKSGKGSKKSRVMFRGGNVI